MKKLSPQDIEDMLIDFSDGVKVPPLAKTYKVTQGTVYYHLKTHGMRSGKRDSMYMEQVKKQIASLQKRINTPGYFTADQLPHARNELGRLKHWLDVDRSCLPSDPFVLQ